MIQRRPRYADAATVDTRPTFGTSVRVVNPDTGDVIHPRAEVCLAPVGGFRAPFIVWVRLPSILRPGEYDYGSYTARFLEPLV